MSEYNCSFGSERSERILAYVYEPEWADRASFEAHLDACDACRTELAELASVRAKLGGWSPPEPWIRSVAAPAHLARERPSLWVRARDVPGWAQAVAALVVLGVSAGVANLDVRYDAAGLSVKTGWLSSERAGADTSTAPPPAAGGLLTEQADPWRQDLSALEARLRSELRLAGDRQRLAASAAATGLDVADGDVMRRVRALVDESERKQQRELALRVAEATRESQAQRQADIVQINRSLGLIQSSTGMEMMRNRQMLNSLAVRVSQTRE